MQHYRTDLSTNVGEDDIHALIDGQLPAGRHREVMAYLAVHPDAADRISAFLRQRVELAALREGLNDVEGLNDDEPEPEFASLEQALCRTVRRQRRVRRVLGAGGLVAAVLVAVAGAWATVGGDAGTAVRRIAGVSSPARESPARSWERAVATAETVASPAGDAAVLWLQAHLAGRSLKQPDLEEFDLRFVGSTALKAARAPAIRLVYADDVGHTYDLFVGVRRSGVELAASLVPEDHVSMSWQQDPLVFTLVAPRGSARLSEIMRSAAALLDPSAPVEASAGSGDGDPAGSVGGSQAGGGGSTATGDGASSRPGVGMPSTGPGLPKKL